MDIALFCVTVKVSLKCSALPAGTEQRDKKESSINEGKVK